jgi:hypothetical protein
MINNFLFFSLDVCHAFKLFNRRTYFNFRCRHRKARPYNGQKKTEKKTNNDIQNIAQKKHVLKKIQRQEQLKLFFRDLDKRSSIIDYQSENTQHKAENYQKPIRENPLALEG